MILAGPNHSMRLDRYPKEYAGSNALLCRVTSTEQDLCRSGEEMKDDSLLQLCHSDYARSQDATEQKGSQRNLLIVFSHAYCLSICFSMLEILLMSKIVPIGISRR